MTCLPGIARKTDLTLLNILSRVLKYTGWLEYNDVNASQCLFVLVLEVNKNASHNAITFRSTVIVTD